MEAPVSKNQRQMAQRTLIVTAMFVIGILVICFLSFLLIANAIQSDRKEPVAAFEGVTVSTLVELPGDRAYPEAITVGADGNLYSGSFCTGDVWRITPAGELTTWVKDGIASVSGMTFGADGMLYVVDHGDCDPRNALSGLKRIAPDGTVTEFASVSKDTILNGLAFDVEGQLYATDTQSGTVRVYDEAGSGKIWWELAGEKTPRPTGLIYDATHHALIVADSGNGTIYRIIIGEDGLPGEVETLYAEVEQELDGLTLDDQGRLIFTIYDQGDVARLNPDGTVDILAENFRNPSDVAYLDGRIYVTNFDSIALAPVVSLLVDPALPFSIDVIDVSAVE